MAFVPTIWSKKIDAALHKFLVATGITNNTWQGDVSQVGDTVKIFRPGAITVSTYDPATGLSAAAKPTDTVLTLALDQAKAFNFKVQDIEALQEDLKKLTAYTEEAAIAMKETMDAFVLSKYADAGLSVNGGAETTVDATNVLDMFLDASKQLSDQGVPLENRFAVVPPALHVLIAKALSGKDTALGDNALQNGYVGKYAGFEVYLSNQVPEVTDATSGNTTYQVMFGHKSAIAFAFKALKIENYRVEADFADAVKGLYVYGATVLEANKLAVLKMIK